MVGYKVQAWCNAKKWPALLAATEALQASCPASGAEGVDLEKKEACLAAFKKLPSMSGTYIPNRLWRSYCIVQGQDLPLRNSCYARCVERDAPGPVAGPEQAVRRQGAQPLRHARRGLRDGLARGQEGVRERRGRARGG